jgi:hypothetical protein
MSRIPSGSRKSKAALAPLFLALVGSIGCAERSGLSPSPQAGAVAGTSASAALRRSPVASPFSANATWSDARPYLFQRFGLRLFLPDKKGWQPQEEKSRFAVIRHAATRSTLVVRVWLENETMRAQSCEAKARLWRDFPTTRDAISRMRSDRPRGFDTEVALGTNHSKLSLKSGAKDVGGDKVVGYVVAFGAQLDRCFAFAYTTTLDKQQSERQMAERLMLVQRRVLNSLRLQRSTAIGRQVR